MAAAEPDTLLEPHRKALQLHCYRMLGSLQEAEDLVQETMLRAWQKYRGYRAASSLRTWLYRIATNACLDALRRRRQPRRLRPPGPASDPRLPVGPPTEEANWLEPYPDSELAGAADGPEDSAIRRETVSLAFCAAVQLLSPRQRAILILGDVLDWRAAEIAALLHLSVPAVESSLHRARLTMRRRRTAGRGGLPGRARRDAAGRGEGLPALLHRLVEAWHADDVDGIVRLLRDDAILSMPPFPAWYQGRESIRTILALHPFGVGKRAGWRLLPTRANGQPAYVLYRADQAGEAFKSFGIVALGLAGSPADPFVSELTVYKGAHLVKRFGFPPEIR